jgi:asparagine synthetase B (glutamine-hydrolysing)
MIAVEQYEPTPLEVASGLVFGLTRPEPLPEPLADPVEALEAAILPALLRPPCVVSFSGGRDSSTILAIAVRLARREGLELPVPATNRFPASKAADETAWQERVIVHLGLTEWARFEFTDELDSIGPVATRALRRHGLLWPFNAHFHMPLIEEASGGAVLTGIGGDETFGSPRWARAASVLSGRTRPRPRDVLAIGLASSPPSVRRTVLSRRDPVILPWLRPEAQQELWAQWTADAAAEPLRWQHRAVWCRRRRYIEVGLRSLQRLAAVQRVDIRSPFVDACFAASLAALPHERRFLTRSDAMRELFRGLLPTNVLTRRTKSQFDDGFWSTHSRAFAAEWDGGSVDTDVVDPEALGREWRSATPDGRTFLLLQSVWLAEDQARSSTQHLEQAVGGRA